MTLDIIEKLIVLFINAFSVFLAIVVLGNSTKVKVNQWFIVMTILITGWVDFSYLGFTTNESSFAVMFYRLNFTLVPAFVYSAYVFLFEYILEIKNKTFKTVLFWASAFLSVLSLFSDFIIKGVINKGWGNEVTFGFLDPIYNLYAVVVALILIYYFISKYNRFSQDEKVKVRYFLIGTILLIVFNLIFNIFYPMFFETIRYQNWGDYSAVIFLAFTAYSIVRHKFMGVKVVLTAMLISIVGMLLTIDILLLSNDTQELIVKMILLGFFIGLSIILVRSVINELKQREQLLRINKALDKSRQRYFDLATEQKDVIDVMGHEIRTPLTAIIQELNIHKTLLIPKKEEWLKDIISAGEKKKMLGLIFDSFDTIDKASSHAVHLVTDMLETARLDKQRFELNYSEFNIVKEVETSVQIMSKSIDEKECKLSFENKVSNDLIVEADKTRVREAIDAILSNSIKYRDTRKDKCFVKVVLYSTDKYFKVDIIDNGIGIAKEDISKLGKKFMRLNPKTNDTLKRPGGTGLGLFVVKGIIDYHKGNFTITSDGIGKGSTFTLEFPLKRK